MSVRRFICRRLQNAKGQSIFVLFWIIKAFCKKMNVCFESIWIRHKDGLNGNDKKTYT
jgi:hypothetical protein